MFHFYIKRKKYFCTTNPQQIEILYRLRAIAVTSPRYWHDDGSGQGQFDVHSVTNGQQHETFSLSGHPPTIHSLSLYHRLSLTLVTTYSTCNSIRHDNHDNDHNNAPPPPLSPALQRTSSAVRRRLLKSAFCNSASIDLTCDIIAAVLTPRITIRQTVSA